MKTNQQQTNGKDKKNNKIQKILKTTGVSDIVSVNRWWEVQDDDNEDSEVKWKSLEHNGVIFPPKYEPNNVPIIFRGNEQVLTPEQEELATFWAQLLDNDLSKSSITRKNFLKEFKDVLGADFKDATLDDFDFTPIYEFLNKQREKNKNRTTEEKKIEKEKKQKLMDYYGYALVDGHSEKISNYMVEPSGIFRGRGEHPLSGKLKSRILPEHVTINVGLDDPVPICHLVGHSWKDVVHNNEATWLAYYKDEKWDKSNKYVFLAANSKFKGMNDRKKYEKARKLKNLITKIREDYTKRFNDEDPEYRQLAVATHLIDKLALRVGNEKGEDEADTVGCCSLRVEHIKLEEDNKITFDFLGKDSMRYHNTIQFDPVVYNLISKFVRGKEPSDDLFDLINASKLNDYLKSLDSSLSAKVFRTFNASVTLQQELDKKEFSQNDSTEDKINYYNEANKQVAILCNHQKTVSKNYTTTSENLQNNLKELINYLVDLQDYLKQFIGKPSKKKEKAANKKEQDDSEEKPSKGKLVKQFPDNHEKTLKIIEATKKKIDKLEFKIKNREDLKEIALGTSKLNYMDPRITVSWCKNNEVPIEKVFTKSVRDKFPWAMYVEPEFKF